MRKLWKVSTCARRQRECHAGPEVSLARIWPDFGLGLQRTAPRRMCRRDVLLALLRSNCKSGGAPRFFIGHVGRRARVAVTGAMVQA